MLQKEPLKSLFNLGIHSGLKPYEVRRAKVFNYCNWGGFNIGLARFIYLSFFSPNHYSSPVLGVNFSPMVISVVLGFLMYKQLYRPAIFTSFLCFPPAIAMMALVNKDNGMEMFIILYLLFAFFFLHRRKQIYAISTWLLICFSTIIIGKEHVTFVFSKYQQPDTILNILNYTTSLGLIVVSLYFIKFEVWSYQQSLDKQKHQLRELNEVKDKVFSVISHDLRTPIASIIMLMKSMEQDVFTEEEIRLLLPELRSSVEETEELLTNLLTWSRNQIEQKEYKASKISIDRLADQAIRVLHRNADNKNIRIINEVPVSTDAYADADGLEVVLRNLIANAIKFTPSGGYVKVHTLPRENFLSISVEDNGIGIAENEKKLLFGDSFFTSSGTQNEKGTGLGLLICRDIIRKNGGDIYFASEKGKGTTFTFTVPCNIK